MKQYVVIGCGRFGTSVAESLYSMGNEVLAIDSSEEIIQNMAPNVTHAVQAEATDEYALKSLGIGNFDVAIISIAGNIQSSIMAALIVKELGVKYIVGKAQSELHAKVLTKIGVDRVVFPEREMGKRVARNLVESNIVDFIELSPEYSIGETKLPDKWVNKTLADIDVRVNYNVSVMAVKNGSKINVAPKATDVLKRDDILVIIGHNDDLRRIENI
ncbi:MAG: TrkA family potassium uptake protein [Clostridiales bacterium]|nr:TrkA family potassium uptake protein [Clostridiales bacterium]